LRAIPWKLNRRRGDWFFLTGDKSDELTDNKIPASFTPNDGNDDIPF